MISKEELENLMNNYPEAFVLLIVSLYKVNRKILLELENYEGDNND